MNSMVIRKHCKRLYGLCRKWRQPDCNPFRKDTAANLEQFLSNFEPSSLNLWTDRKLITKINFSHPLFKAVFENRITNFQYPKTNGSFTITNRNPAGLYNDDQSTFLTALPKALSTVYVFQHLLARQIQTFNSLRLSFLLSIKWQWATSRKV
jgi:hypothetical protein